MTRTNLVRFLSLPWDRKIAAITNRFIGSIFSIFSAFKIDKRVVACYTPDSIVHAKSHLEVFPLYEQFRKYNKANNGGDIQRIISFVLNIKKVVGDDEVEGHFAEVGVYKGNSAAILAHYAREYNRNCYLFDTFKGFNKSDIVGVDSEHKERHFADTSLELVKDVIGSNNLKSCQFVIGYFPESVPEVLCSQKFSVVSLDCDLYKPMKAGLDWFFPRMDNGAIFLLHDYGGECWEGAKNAIDEFCKSAGQHLILIPDKSGSAFIRVRK